jgi:hypothetical protein
MIIFIVASRYPEWTQWNLELLDSRIKKGRDFASRIDESINFPSMAPEDQLILAVHLFQRNLADLLKKPDVDLKLDLKIAELIARARFEHQGRSVDSFVKHSNLVELGKSLNLGQEHLPSSGIFTAESLLLGGLEIDRLKN